MQRLNTITAATLVIASLLGGCSVSPRPLTGIEISARADSQLARVAANQEAVGSVIDLYQAVARALKYNLDQRVEIMDAALRVRELDFAHYSMLPNMVANTGFSERSNYAASSSFNVLTHTNNFGASTSQERRNSSADAAFSWNILDFGLSYVRAQQAADKVLISEEGRRKVVHRIVEDVRTAYWRSVSGENLLTKLQVLEGRVRKAQLSSKAISVERNTSPITAVTYERELVEIKRAIQDLERELVIAKSQLAALMNMKPGTVFNLAMPSRSHNHLALTAPVDAMIATAMQNRAELRDVWYRDRINQQEYDAAFLELLPGLQIFAGTNYDSNEFLYNSNWLSWGAKASWSLMKIAQYPSKRAVISAQGRLLDERALALTLAVMTQVHVSRVRFYHFEKEFRTANEYLEVQTRLVGLMRKEADGGKISEQTLIREEMNTLVAEVKRDITHASLQNAFANVYASMGLDPHGEHFKADLSVAQLADVLRGVWIERGDRHAVEANPNPSIGPSIGKSRKDGGAIRWQASARQ
jgi:outer membrane protein TolC